MRSAILFGFFAVFAAAATAFALVPPSNAALAGFVSACIGAFCSLSECVSTVLRGV